MIIKNFMEGDIVAMKLISGEEVIARITEESDNSGCIFVKKPLMLIINQEGAGFVPFMITLNEDAEVKIHEDKIIIIDYVNEKIKNAYIQQTSNIQIVR